MILGALIAFIFIAELRFRPRFEVTVNRDLLLFYNVYTFGTRRNYIDLKIKI